MSGVSKWRRWRLRWCPPRCVGPWCLPAGRERCHVFLLLGQSNMAGHGCMRDDDPWLPGDFDPVPGAWVLGGQATPQSARARGRACWRPAAHPLHLNQKSSAFGLGIEFARVYQKLRPDTGVGLVPCAWGGAGIDAFAAGRPLRVNAVRRARLAARHGVVRGILWHQGETDTMAEDLARDHESKLRSLIAGLRSDLGIADLRFVIGDLSPVLAATKQRSDPRWALRIDRVRTGLRRVAEADPHAAWVRSDGLPGTQPDPFHFDRAALVELGARYARAMAGEDESMLPQQI